MAGTVSQWITFHFCHFQTLFAGLNGLKPASGKKHFLPAKMPTLDIGGDHDGDSGRGFSQ